MKAITNRKYGPPETLVLEEIEKPKIKKDSDVLIKVYASSVNPVEKYFCIGKPKIVRFIGLGMFKPKRLIPGADVAGVIEQVGSQVKKFKVGDAVFGEIAQGGYAEYVVAPEKFLTKKPDSLSFEAAGCIGVAGLTAVQALRTHAKIKKGDKVLINGASGGVGTFAVQIAKAIGAEVTAVCSTEKVEITKSLGADQVIDYTKDDFRKQSPTYDTVLDIVGNVSIKDYKKLLANNGKGVLIGMQKFGFMLKVMIGRGFARMKRGRKVFSFTAQPNQDDLAFIAELLEQNRIQVYMDQTYPLHQVPHALAYLIKGHAKGKIGIEIIKE